MIKGRQQFGCRLIATMEGNIMRFLVTTGSLGTADNKFIDGWNATGMLLLADQMAKDTGKVVWVQWSPRDPMSPLVRDISKSVHTVSPKVEGQL